MKTQVEVDGIVTLTKDGENLIRDSPLYNDGLRPTNREEHSWTTYNFASLWIGMSICLPTYAMAAGLISLGMNWWQAILTIILGNCIVLIPILLNSHAGTKFGIPYPVFARLWFGSKGAHIPALARGLIGAGWFGINCWFGGTAIDTLLQSLGGWGNVPGHTWIAFFGFWALNVWIAYRGPEAIRRMEFWAAPTLIVMGLALLVWAITKAGGWGPMLSAPSKLTTTADFLKVFFPALTGAIAFWSTMALNIPDFCRYAKSQKAQMVGQSVALPTTMGGFSFIGVAVASATVVIYGEAIWDPAAVLAKFSPLAIFLGTLGIILATLTTNVAANVVAPARAFENLVPRRMSFGAGAILTGIIALLMQPWYILENFSNYIFLWLGTYGALLGPIDGIAIADYWLVRKRRIHLVELYRLNGMYSYKSGYNMRAIWAMLIGIAVPFVCKLIPGLTIVWDNAWTCGLLISLVIYTWLMKNTPNRMSAADYENITARSVEQQAS
ncbi:MULTISPECIES: NCS1 family nucleobase:cation symporter-1 [Bacillales]|jgi:NCS1 family nucleobase:cation symporter-1|uniref:NCS1 family nucleobase:cation symporter-1 n=1 Tax=Brevibacillus TaxID=55080 RepID=UPI000E38FBEC|nr:MULTISPECIES: NCS1 family nucleobase:cation symporter-1 [Bacillales]MBR8659598.1 NCS1 family nucleobase:cation symporter-1 [Brevibacillus sp. NL20B1]NNV03812.1 nitrate reductase [Brevibacillus sp. MCWH]REK65864.1 MAG: nitrate reductase [Brevibacillus sp.]UFJ60662.1 NCS1 family nucleobase:cation symporter-1 [Anoxybacillus sediminis]